MLTISTYFDESGKFKDHDVVSFGGVVSPSMHFNGPFRAGWARCLDANGLETLTMKEALHAERPLSDKNPAIGVESRTASLIPFIDCIRKHLMVITGLAIDARAYAALPSHYHQAMGDNPCFTAFTRTLLGVLEVTDTEDKISLVCDDEEEAAWPMYQLFRRVKILYPEARDKLRAITFADDRWSFGLQAADLVVSLTRQEAAKKFFGTEYEYSSLFSALSNPHPKDGDKFWLIQFGFCDAAMLERLGDSWVKAKPHTLAEAKAVFKTDELQKDTS
jgi:hypothetical protein